MPSDLMSIIQNSVLKCRKNARDVAKEIGKPYPTLMREINPDDKGAKVGVETLVPLMRATGNIQPLNHVATAMGYVLTPLNLDMKDPQKPNLMALDLMDGFGIYAQALKTALNSEKLSHEDVSDVEKAGYEAMSAIMTMIRYLRNKTPKQEKSDAPMAKAI